MYSNPLVNVDVVLPFPIELQVPDEDRGVTALLRLDGYEVELSVAGRVTGLRGVYMTVEETIISSGTRVPRDESFAGSATLLTHREAQYWYSNMAKR